jgi:hypothetical protein
VEESASSLCKGEFTLIFSALLIISHCYVCFSIIFQHNDYAKLLLQEDLYYPHPLIQDLLWDSLYIFTEPLLTRWPFHKLVREKALQVTMKHIHYEDENSQYITIGCVEKVILSKIKGSNREHLLRMYNSTTKVICIEQVLCMLACWVEDPNGDYFKKHIARIPDYIWVAEDGIKMQVNRHILQKIYIYCTTFLAFC